MDNIKYLEFEIGTYGLLEDIYLDGERYEFNDQDKFQEECPTIAKDNGNVLTLKIDIETGRVVNWPEGKEGSFRTVKVVDTGKYRLLDNNDKVLFEYEGYVPEILEVEEKGWGDYMEFEVNKDGTIPNWKGTDELKKQFIENC